MSALAIPKIYSKQIHVKLLNQVQCLDLKLNYQI
jgi:hypothetical protein